MADNEMTLKQKIELYKHLEENRKEIIQLRKEAENYAAMCLMFIIGIVVGASGSIFANSILNVMKSYPSYHVVDAAVAVISMGILVYFGGLFYRQCKLNSKGADAIQGLLDYRRPLLSEIEKELKKLNKKKK